ncbi:MAG: LLM class flavin-dependent oxidoreductase [Dehalococcoidia bacterium]|nr:LLM class flavin-dependent oxidoreductase [Dehalococcoidia bacterium]
MPQPQFGVFSLLSVPDVRDEVALVQGELEINCYAEEAGFDAVWLAEHSGSRYGLIASPQVMAAAIAARTRRIRIGTGVSVLPLHQPLRLANDFAMIDVLSGGRLDYGVGRGYSADEYASYGLDVTENRARFDEAFEVILKAWTQESFSHDGTYYHIPSVQSVPSPIQRPHPPLYVAAGSPETVTWAAQRLVGILSSSGSAENIAAKWQAYREAARAAGHADAAIEEALARSWVVKHIYVAADDETAVREAGPAFMWFFKLLANRRMFDGPIEPRPLEWWQERGACYFGSAETVTARLAEWQAASGVQNTLCWVNTGGMPAARVLHSMRLFGERVIPALRPAAS